jgi:hypothetical protein
MFHFDRRDQLAIDGQMTSERYPTEIYTIE